MPLARSFGRVKPLVDPRSRIETPGGAALASIYGGVCPLRPLPPPTTPLASLGLARLAKPDGEGEGEARGAGTNYATDKMNTRLILAGKNAVAVDTIEALVMKCDPTQVPHLTRLAAAGLGTTDATKITVVGKQVSEVAKPFVGGQTAICPGR